MKAITPILYLKLDSGISSVLSMDSNNLKPDGPWTYSSKFE